MKKLTPLIIISIIIASTFTLTVCPVAASFALAVDMPYVIIGENIWLMNKETGGKLFLLPETYYARVDNLDENYYYVTFNGVSGKVDKNSVSTIGYHTEASGTVQELRIDPKYNYFTEIKLKSSMDGASEDLPAPVSASFIFLGKYPLTDMWYYVKYNDICGYIRAEFTTNPDISIPAFVPEEKPQEPTVDEPAAEQPKDNAKLVKILVITGLSVALVVLLILLFRPKKKGVNKYYYEDTGE